MKKILSLVLAVLILTAATVTLTSCAKDPLAHLYGKYEDENVKVVNTTNQTVINSYIEIKKDKVLYFIEDGSKAKEYTYLKNYGITENSLYINASIFAIGEENGVLTVTGSHSLTGNTIFKFKKVS